MAYQKAITGLSAVGCRAKKMQRMSVTGPLLQVAPVGDIHAALQI
jgi:hypothetical protein